MPASLLIPQVTACFVTLWSSFRRHESAAALLIRQVTVWLLILKVTAYDTAALLPLRQVTI